MTALAQIELSAQVPAIGGASGIQPEWSKAAPAASVTFIAATPGASEAYASHLADHGYAVSRSIGVEEAVRHAREHCPDLVFLDLGESSKAGLATLEACKADVCLGAVPIVILGSFDRMEDVHAGLEMGACDYIIKTETSTWSLARGVSDWMRMEAQVHQSVHESATRTDGLTAPRLASEPDVDSEPRIRSGMPRPLMLPQS